MNVVSFGGGTNSTAMIIGMYLHKIPIDLILFTDPGDVVIDPVAGSGTTLRAAYELGRSAYGFEVDKSFYEAAREKMLAPILAEKTTI